LNNIIWENSFLKILLSKICALLSYNYKALLSLPPEYARILGGTPYEWHIETKGGKMKTQKKIYRSTAFTSLFISSLIVFWGFQVCAEEWNDTQKEVWKAVESAWEYFKQGDLEGFKTIYHDDAVEWWEDRTKPYGKKDMMPLFKGWLDYDKPISCELEPRSIQVLGNIAIVLYTTKWKGNTISVNGRNMQTWIKQEDKWKFISGMAASCDNPLKCE
jgi:ketosteroid isomerase-like protein